MSRIPDGPVIRLTVDIVLDEDSEQDKEKIVADLKKDVTLASLVSVVLIENGIKGRVDSRDAHHHTKFDGGCEKKYGEHVCEEAYAN